jgi:hypothetical protein
VSAVGAHEFGLRVIEKLQGRVGIVAVNTSGAILYWNGFWWQTYPVKVWNGSAWVQKPIRHWTGTAWE